MKKKIEETVEAVKGAFSLCLIAYVLYYLW